RAQNQGGGARDAATIGGTVTITQTLANNGVLSAPNAVVGGSLPPSWTITACLAEGGNCSFQANNITVTYPTLGPGQTSSISLTAETPGTPNGLIEYVSNVFSDTPIADYAASNFSLFGNSDAAPPLGITVTPIGTFSPGLAGSYTVTIKNNSASPTQGL